MTVLVVELLGGLRVATETGSEIRIASRKAQAVLACLALRFGSAVPRDYLASLLWDDSDADLARASLRQALAALRRCLPPEVGGIVVSDTASVSLDRTRTRCDVESFRELVRDGSPRAVAEAAERFDAELLPGFEVRSPAFEAWLDEQRRALRRDWSVALQRAAAQCRAAGDHGGAIAALSRLVAVEPGNEAAHRDLMEAYARQGLYTEALRQYRVCADALRRDLDVAPDPVTETLHRDILRRRRATVPDDRRGATGELAPNDATGRMIDASPAPATVSTLREIVVLVARISRGRAGDDPEAVREDWHRAESRVCDEVQRFGGVADRVSQGEIVAAFGLKAATGNEIGRALRAAARLTESTGETGEPVLAIGIARGLVLPAAGDDPFPLTGQPLVHAQALARAAPAGGVRVATDIAAQVTSPAPCELAGRRAELALLTTLFDRVAASARGRVVVVRGEAGIGKSALLGAVAEAARGRAGVYVVGALDFGQPVGERPIAALAARMLDAAPAADPDARRAALETAIASGRLAPGEAAQAAELLALDRHSKMPAPAMTLEPAARERGRLRVLQRLLADSAARGPALVIVEDVHWADPGEMTLLAELAGSVAHLPVLLALSTRPEGDPISPAWRTRARGCPITVLDLAPLAEDEARELAARYGDLPAGRLELCLETAAGNPLFLVQLLRGTQAGDLRLPNSIRALLLARVERLPVEMQRLLHAAAVLGTRFGAEELRYVAALPDGAATDVEVPGLLACDGIECRFAHALVREAVYESLLRSARRSLHRRAAHWYEKRDPGLYAEHLTAAEDPAAPEAHRHAAVIEQQACRFERARRHAEHALALAHSDADRCDAAAVLGESCLALGCTEQAIAAFRSSAALATEPGPRARARLGLATALRVLDRLDDALDVLEAAESDAVDEGNPRRLARVWTLRGNLHFPRGELDRCLRAHERALELAQEAGSVEDIARALGGLGDAEYQRGRMRSSLGYVTRCLDLAGRHGLADLRFAYLPMAAACRAYDGEFEAAAAIAREAADAAREAGDRRAELIATNVIASTAVYRAMYEQAQAHAARATRLARELGAVRFEAEGLVIEGLARLGGGERDQALALLEQAVERSMATAPTYCGAWALAALALATRDETRGRALIDEAERLLALGCVSHNHLEFRMLAIEFLLDLGDWPGVEAHAARLAHFTRDEPLPWADLVISRARALAAAAGAPPDEAVAGALRDSLARCARLGFATLEPRLRTALGRPH